MTRFVPGQHDIYREEPQFETEGSLVPEVLHTRAVDTTSTENDDADKFDLFEVGIDYIDDQDELEEHDEVEDETAVTVFQSEPIDVGIHDDDRELENENWPPVWINDTPKAPSTLVGLALPSNDVPALPTKSILETIRDRNAQKRVLKAEAAEQANLDAAKRQEAHERTLKLRETESNARYIEYSVNLLDVCQRPVLQTPKYQEGSFPLFNERDLGRLRLPRYINDQISAEMQRSVLQQTSGSIKTVELSQQVLGLSFEQMQSSDIVRTLIGAVVNNLDGKRKNSITTTVREEDRLAFDEQVAAETDAALQQILVKAAEKYIINPYPEHEPHKVYAFRELTTALGINEAETSVDENFLQPVVKTRMIFHDGEIKVDKNIDGIGKLYASFGSQSTYEMIGQEPDPQNITGLVRKRPIDGYTGNFMVHMRERSFGPDHDYNQDSTDGSVAYTVQFDVNTYHVDPELYSQTQSNINEQLTVDGQLAHRAGHPLEHAAASVKVHSTFTLPAQRDIVTATMLASSRANRVFHEEQQKVIQQLDKERSETFSMINGIGGAVLGGTLEIDRR